MLENMTEEQAQAIIAQRIPSYRIVKALGSGTYGAVFLAHDKDTEQQYAVKLFRLVAQRETSEVDGSITDATTRMNRDWRLLMDHHARLKACPALVEIPMFFKVDTQENVRGRASAWGIAVMAYYPANLHDYILDYREDHGKPLPATRRLALLQALAKTLDTLHGMTDSDGHPFVYEDLKPENVLVADLPGSETPRVVIGDIGGLKRIGGSSMSSEGQKTLSYASPEVFPPAKQRVDRQSVVYSFGLVGYFVIEGRRPYSGMDLIERFERIESDPGFTSAMTEGLKPAAEVIRRCLRMDRAERYADFASVVQALMEGRSGSGPTLKPKRLPREEQERQDREEEAQKAQARKKQEEAEHIFRPKIPGMSNEWRCPITGMEFVFVPGGVFQMGDLFGEGLNPEKPVHEVRLDDFWIGKYPVTQGEWMKVMKNNPSKFKKGDNYPVEQVSWHDAQAYIEVLNKRGDGKYRLLTEAEWEYACRSGGKKEQYAGSNDVDRVAWYNGNSGRTTHPVGQKAPNGLGLYDMSGNVWEWVSDWYDRNFYANSPRDNPQGPSSGSDRVKRGGCWLSYPAHVRSAARSSRDPGNRYDGLGFRLARNVP